MFFLDYLWSISANGFLCIPLFVVTVGGLIVFLVFRKRRRHLAFFSVTLIVGFLLGWIAMPLTVLPFLEYLWLHITNTLIFIALLFLIRRYRRKNSTSLFLLGTLALGITLFTPFISIMLAIGRYSDPRVYERPPLNDVLERDFDTLDFRGDSDTLVKLEKPFIYDPMIVQVTGNECSSDFKISLLNNFKDLSHSEIETNTPVDDQFLVDWLLLNGYTQYISVQASCPWEINILPLSKIMRLSISNPTEFHGRGSKVLILEGEGTYQLNISGEECNISISWYDPSYWGGYSGGGGGPTPYSFMGSIPKGGIQIIAIKFEELCSWSMSIEPKE